MANDIQKSISANNIKNRTIVVSSCPTTGSIKTLDAFVTNNPTISDIQAKYDNRFDDPSYYFGIGDSGVIGT